MLKISENHQLISLNTFSINARAKFFAECFTNKEILDVIREKNIPLKKLLILSGGSNILFTDDYNGLILKISTGGIETIREDNDHVWVRAQAGVNWHELVTYSLSRDLGGLENLSLIPGNAGAAPIQNIGAYGTEQKDVFTELEALNLATGRVKVFDKAACRFGYRDSIFKNEFKGKWIVISVTYRLNKNPKINTSYGAIGHELKQMGVEHATVKDVGEAVCRIRNRKLPDPGKTGNAGSFFKNPIIGEKQFQRLQQKYPDLIFFPLGENRFKLAAGWMIDKLGWKGYRKGDAGVCKSQALVLVNHGHATGKEILGLANEIRKSVKAEFDVELQPEVNIV